MPDDARACYVFAHGDGAGMTHPFMAAVADQFEHRGIATVRYQFPYMERGSKRPDPPRIAHAAVRAAVAERASSAQTYSGVACDAMCEDRLESGSSNDKSRSAGFCPGGGFASASSSVRAPRHSCGGRVTPSSPTWSMHQ